MGYFSASQIPLAGRADLFQGGGTDFQSLLDASAFDLGTASVSDLTQTTAAPATGPSGSVQSSAESSEDLLTLNGIPLGKASDATFNDRLNLGLAQAILEKDNPDRDDSRLRKFQQMMRQEAEYANKMGRQNALLGFALKDLPKFMAAPARAAATYDNLNAQAPYLGAQNSKRYFS
jgi:hypothetical protein